MSNTEQMRKLMESITINETSYAPDDLIQLIVDEFEAGNTAVDIHRKYGDVTPEDVAKANGIWMDQRRQQNSISEDEIDPTLNALQAAYKFITQPMKMTPNEIIYNNNGYNEITSMLRAAIQDSGNMIGEQVEKPNKHEIIPNEVWAYLNNIIDSNPEQYEYADNFRAYRISDGFMKHKYTEIYNQGCCGYFDDKATITVAGQPEEWVVGFNYGH